MSSSPRIRGGWRTIDRPLPIGDGQTISQPYIVALMTDLLDPHIGDRILEIGAGSGYQAAILAELASEVITIERIPAVAARARRNLSTAGSRPAEVIVADGTLGYPQKAPYQGILVTAGTPEVPQPLIGQLADGGRLVAPVGPHGIQELVRIVREGERNPPGVARRRGLRPPHRGARVERE